MTSPLVRLCQPASILNMGLKCGVATVPPQANHPNPGNFANRSHDELSAMGQRGGKKGGKARGGRSQVSKSHEDEHEHVR